MNAAKNLDCLILLVLSSAVTELTLFVSRIYLRSSKRKEALKQKPSNQPSWNLLNQSKLLRTQEAWMLRCLRITTALTLLTLWRRTPLLLWIISHRSRCRLWAVNCWCPKIRQTRVLKPMVWKTRWVLLLWVWIRLETDPMGSLTTTTSCKE